MFSSSELAAMTATVAESLGAGSGLGVSLVLHRGAQVLAAQNARLVRPGGAGVRSGDGTESAQATVSVVGLPAMDIRAGDRFNVAGQAYTLQTVYNVPEFDTLAYSTALTANMLRATAVTGRVLFWNPGQGHLPAFLAQQAGPSITEFALAGRDLLSLRIAAHNLAGQPVTVQHEGMITAVPGGYDWAIITPDDDPGVAYEKLLWPAFERLVKPGGNVVVTAVSAFIFRLLERGTPPGWRVVENKKRHGSRTLWLSRERA